MTIGEVRILCAAAGGLQRRCGLLASLPRSAHALSPVRRAPSRRPVFAAGRGCAPSRSCAAAKRRPARREARGVPAAAGRSKRPACGRRPARRRSASRAEAASRRAAGRDRDLQARRAAQPGDRLGVEGGAAHPGRAGRRVGGRPRADRELRLAQPQRGALPPARLHPRPGLRAPHRRGPRALGVLEQPGRFRDLLSGTVGLRYDRKFFDYLDVAGDGTLRSKNYQQLSPRAGRVARCRGSTRAR